MGIFSRNKKPSGILTANGETINFLSNEPTIDERAELERDTAIAYVVSLNKTDKDKFFEGVDLIWQGYNNIASVKTSKQRELHRTAKNMGVDDNDEILGFIADDMEGK